MKHGKKLALNLSLALAIGSSPAFANTQTMQLAGKSHLKPFTQSLNETLCTKLWPRSSVKHCEVVVENLRFAPSTQSRDQSVTQYLTDAGAAVVDGTPTSIRLPIARRALGGGTYLNPIKAFTFLDLGADLQRFQAEVDQSAKDLIASFGADWTQWKMMTFSFTDGSDLSYIGTILFHEKNTTGNAPDAIWISNYSGG